MFGSNTLKAKLIATTALLEIAFVSAMSWPAQAATISTNVTGPVNVGAASSLTITSTGSITGGSGAIVNGVSAISVTNNGVITVANTGIIVNNGGVLSGSISNTGHITSTAHSGIFVKSGSTVSGGISNSGTITGHGDAIYVETNSLISGGITNSGHLIAGTSYGLEIAAGSTVSGGISNSGTIQSALTGIFVHTTSTVSGGITNSGTIDATTGPGIGITSGSTVDTINNTAGGVITGQTGILVSAATISGGITNSGRIDAANTGILVKSGGLIGGSISNTGHITSTAHSGIFVKSGSTVSGGISNSGTITGHGDAIYVETNSLISGGITNSGQLTAGTSYGLEIAAGSTVSGGISNSGTIQSALTGIFVHTTSTVSGGITNSGTIDATNGPGIGITSGSTVDTITNTASGVITGQTGILVSAAKVTGGITNSGTIDGTGGTAISLVGLTAASPITIDGGRIIGDVIDTTAVASDFSPVTVNGAFATDGNFTVSNLTVATSADLTISPGNVFTTSRMTTPSTGTFTFGVNGTTSGELINNAGPVDLTTASIAERIIGAAPVSGHQYLIADGVGAISGGPGGTLTTLADSPYLWTFKIVDGTDAADLLLANQTGNKDLYLLVNQSHTISGTATSGSNVTIGNVLEGLGGTVTNPQLQGIINNLNNAGSAQGVNDVLSSAAPTLDASDEAGSVDVSDQTLGLTNDRLLALRTGDDTTGMAAGNMSKGLGAWGQAFGQHIDQSARDGIAGYNANTYGAALGLDTSNISEQAILGAAFSYGRTNANSKNANSTDTNVDSYQVSLYGNLDLHHGYYLNGMGSYGWDSIDRTRHDVGGAGGSTAHGSYNAHQFDVLAEGGKDIAYSGMTLTPNVTAHWVNWNPDSYTETGAGGANLHVNGSTLNEFELGGGVKAGWSFKNSDGSWIKPQLRAGYRYAVTDDKISDTAQFTGGGAAFTVDGANPARSAVDLGASVKFLTTSNWDFTASYDFDWKSDYTASAGFVRAAYKF